MVIEKKHPDGISYERMMVLERHHLMDYFVILSIYFLHLKKDPIHANDL